MENVPFIVILLGAILIGIVVFIICRVLVLWYFRINNRVALMEENNKLLNKIFIQLGGTLETKTNVEIEDPAKTFDYLDEKGNIRHVTAKTAEKTGWTLIKK